MKAKDLYEKLIQEGCNAKNFCIGSAARANDAFCLTKIKKSWVVFYTERGINSAPIFSSDNESEAVEFFYDFVRKQQHWHLIGSFTKEKNALKLEKKLKEMNVQPIRNDIPSFKLHGDKRFRVFVSGKDVFQARKLIES